ncbi:MAG: hypothetical protein ACFCU8_13085 [Thermosynechococcaceae cyanobacterium]
MPSFSLRLIHYFLGVFGTSDRPSPLPSQLTFWALSPPQPRLKPLP